MATCSRPAPAVVAVSPHPCHGRKPGGITLETVEMQPIPPRDIIGMVLVIVARIYIEPVADVGRHLAYLGDIAGGLFYTCDVRMLRQHGYGRRRYVHAGAGRHRIHYDRDADAVCDIFIVGDQPVFTAFVIIRRYYQEARRPLRLPFPLKAPWSACAVGTECRPGQGPSVGQGL